MYLDSFVDYLNATIKTRMGSKASRSRFYGVCKIVEKDLNGEKTVVIYDNTGNDFTVQDDTYWLIIYHRFLGYSFQSNEVNAVNSFGDGASTKAAFANFVMGVYGDRKNLNLTDLELMASVSFSFPDVVPQSIISQLTGMQQAIFSPVSSNSTPTEPIITNPENIFFTLNYRIAISGDVNCLSDCYPDCV